MWKIVYTINRHYRSVDNYPAVDCGDPESVEGETAEEAIKNLAEQLRTDADLNYLIESYAKNLDSHDGCTGISIISMDQVVSSDKFDFEKHPIFLSLINARRTEIAKKEKGAKKRKEKAIRDKELRQLQTLKNKYEQDT